MTLQPHEIPYDFFERTQIITGLRHLADFLAAHPDVPVPRYGWEMSFFPDGAGDAIERADIDRVAAVLNDFGGRRIDDSGNGGHDKALITFGRITYQVIRVPERRRELHEARTSYEPNITLD
jgi:hypothetical protein